MRTRKELMNRLNELLNVSYNWSRLNSLDLQRLVNAVEKLINNKGYYFGGVRLE